MCVCVCVCVYKCISHGFQLKRLPDLFVVTVDRTVRKDSGTVSRFIQTV